MRVKCPMCSKDVEWNGNPFRPFCSERCKLTDLGKWAADEYRIAGSPLNDDNADYNKDIEEE
ncbi:MAG: DNA gyrase inhibitor YacG [Nitrospirae bacterium]|nr:DNA gyrase inhibitor YacG [Nitrospirota bacterium]MBF0521309.1 DNA gyrase inhibitor YacG [Nitrospirota bacterium]MBF0534608.1 DNA gyrase inhibitor YacG [Nitrospirota bacterium]MBF0616348.1 DNA gyrase inhibitor YacG [Nitrospirota bacterium]